MVDLRLHRWNRIFKADGRTVIFAMDHAGAFGMMEGIEKPGEVVKRVADGGADAILTTFGIAKNFGNEIGRMGLVLRCDGGTSKLGAPAAGSLTVNAYDALRVGADAVGVMGLPGSKFEDTQLPYLAELISQCTEWNIPVMAEALPGGFENPKEMWTPENLGHANRICAEMGVDFLKTTFKGVAEASIKKIIDQLYIPVVVLGGGKSDDPRDLLSDIHNSIQAGANGVAVGRNIYQYKQPEKITAAIVAIVHGNATVDEAAKLLK